VLLMPLNTKCLSIPQLPEHGRIRISMLGRRADFCGRELENILQQPVLALHVGHSHPDLKAAAALQRRRAVLDVCHALP